MAEKPVLFIVIPCYNAAAKIPMSLPFVPM